jgi:probable phosphoglycerate mutase
MLELWLIRHAETLWNAQRRIQGQSDAPLSARGVAQAERLALRLNGVPFERVYSSDTRRALHTAEIALGGEKVEPEPRLREMSYGTLEGKIRSELVGAEREAFTAYWRDPYRVALPQGESWRELDARVAGWLSDLPCAGRVAAFSHGGTIRSALFYVTGSPKKREWNVLFGTTSITRLRLGEAKTVVSLNDTAHLLGSGLEDDGA